MTALVVDTAARTLTAFGRNIPCTIGRGGAIAAADKREGDGMTPLGLWPIRTVLLRPDRLTVPRRRPGSSSARETGPRPTSGYDSNAIHLPWRWLRPDDGWSDDPTDPAYNRPVRHPHRFSAERLWRDDGLYDAILVLGYNNAAPVPGLGSAIFLHCWNEGQPTEGCIAIAKEALLAILPLLATGDHVEVG